MELIFKLFFQNCYENHSIEFIAFENLWLIKKNQFKCFGKRNPIKIQFMSFILKNFFKKKKKFYMKKNLKLVELFKVSKSLSKSFVLL